MSISLRELVDIFDRVLPCPPDPMPELHTTARYLWEATLFNASQDPPRRYVQLRGRPTEDGLSETIVTVECDGRGKGVRVLT
jgi:hypothetical protein